jgi:hypothetical protein
MFFEVVYSLCVAQYKEGALVISSKNRARDVVVCVVWRERGEVEKGNGGKRLHPATSQKVAGDFFCCGALKMSAF